MNEHVQLWTCHLYIVLVLKDVKKRYSVECKKNIRTHFCSVLYVSERLGSRMPGPSSDNVLDLIEFQLLYRAY
jgi:hypothetical protein